MGSTDYTAALFRLEIIMMIALPMTAIVTTCHAIVNL